MDTFFLTKKIESDKSYREFIGPRGILVEFKFFWGVLNIPKYYLNNFNKNSEREKPLDLFNN